MRHKGALVRNRLGLRQTMKVIFVSIVLLAMAGCQGFPGVAERSASAYAAVREGETRFIRTELYFAIGWAEGSQQREEGIDGNSLGEAGWTRFVDEVVTPLFPDGLTIFDGTGQWLSDRFAVPPKLETRVIVILHPNAAEADNRIEKIRQAFLELTGQQSVLRVSQAAEVSF